MVLLDFGSVGKITSGEVGVECMYINIYMWTERERERET